MASFGNNIFAGTSNTGVFLSTNNGANWSLSRNGLADSSSYALAVCDTIIFAGGSTGKVYVSSDKGTNWELFTGGLPGIFNINFLAVKGKSIFAGTAGGGLWMHSISELVGVSEENIGLPKQFTLSQNYPNPFNPTTIIQYSLATKQFVTLKVYNLLGKEITTLVNEERPEGQYSLNFNAGNIPSGVYFYTIRAGSFTETKKMLLLK
jgi:hypothetical protein